MVVLSNFYNKKQLDYFEEKYKDLDITLFFDVIPSKEQLSLSPRNYLVLHEPNELFRLHDTIIPHASKFDAIFTYSKRLLKLLPNAIYFHHNGLISTEDEEYYNSFKTKEKQFEVSFLCGTTNWAEGHKLRQKVYKLKNKISIPKQWYYVLEDFDVTKQVRPGYNYYSKDLSHIPDGEAAEHYGKRILFNDSMFHIAVENCEIDNWYTEKISQAFATKTVPLYWGCKNLRERGYDERGIIRFTNENHLLEIVNNLTPEDYYKRLPYINYNYQVSLIDTFRTQLHKILNYLK
jgi:hypothetical protein